MNLFSHTNWQIRLYVGVFSKCFNNLYLASGHTLYARLRTSRWLNTTNKGVFPFVVHMACNNMDATYLSGNEWIIYLYAMVSLFVFFRRPYDVKLYGCHLLEW